jgi:hypothetical protein
MLLDCYDAGYELASPGRAVSSETELATGRLVVEEVSRDLPLPKQHGGGVDALAEA